jgi:hypothetical protein
VKRGVEQLVLGRRLRRLGKRAGVLPCGPHKLPHPQAADWWAVYSMACVTRYVHHTVRRVNAIFIVTIPDNFIVNGFGIGESGPTESFAVLFAGYHGCIRTMEFPIGQFVEIITDFH